MKITCLQENLRAGLGIAVRAVSSRSTLPIYEHVLLHTEDGALRLTGNNGEMGITCFIGAQIEEEGGVTIPAKLLKEFVDSLPKERVSMRLSLKTMTLRLKCDRFKSNMKGLVAEDFPAIVTPTDDCISIPIEGPDLVQALGLVVFAAAQDESRPILKGVRVTYEDGHLRFAAADGFRGALYHLPVSPNVAQTIEQSGVFDDQENNPIVIPSNTLDEVAKVAKGFDGLVEFIVSPDVRRVFFKIDEILISSQLIEGQYPAIERLVPDNYATQTILDRDDFLGVTKVNHLFARESANIIVVDIDGGDENHGVTMSAQSAELGDNEAFVNAEIEGDDIMIAFNCKFVLDVLGAIDSPKIVLETSKPESPGVFRIPTDKDGFENYWYVIMPMQIRAHQAT